MAVLVASKTSRLVRLFARLPTAIITAAAACRAEQLCRTECLSLCTVTLAAAVPAAGGCSVERERTDSAELEAGSSQMCVYLLHAGAHAGAAPSAAFHRSAAGGCGQRVCRQSCWSRSICARSRWWCGRRSSRCRSSRVTLRASAVAEALENAGGFGSCAPSEFLLKLHHGPNIVLQGRLARETHRCSTNRPCCLETGRTECLHMFTLWIRCQIAHSTMHHACCALAGCRILESKLWQATNREPSGMHVVRLSTLSRDPRCQQNHGCFL